MEIEKSNQGKVTRETVINNFSRWNNALLTKDPTKVAQLYTEDVTFLPTVSGEFKKGRLDVETYFKSFLKKDVISEIVQDEIQDLGVDCYLHSGMYNFEVGPTYNRQTIKARFSFVWKQNQQGEWKIIHHHSSVRPE